MRMRGGGNGRRGQGARHHDGDLGLEVRGKRLARDHVDVGLVELPEAALLGALASPHLLDLEAPERELEVALALLDVARERARSGRSAGRTRRFPSRVA